MSRQQQKSIKNKECLGLDETGVLTILLLLLAVIAYIYIYSNKPSDKSEDFEDIMVSPYRMKADRHRYTSPLKLPGGSSSSWNTLTRGSGLAGMYDGIYDGALTVGTMPSRTREEIDKILGQVLEEVNRQTGAKYILRKIDRANVECLRKGTVGCEKKFRATGEFVLGARYTIDFFAHESRDQETRRFIVIFVVNTDNEVQVEHLNLANAFKHNPKFRDLGTQNVGDTGKPYWKDLIITDEALTNSNGVNQTGTNDGLDLSISPFKADGAGWLAPRSPHEFSQKFLPRQGFQQPAEDTEIGRARYFPNRRHSKWWDPLGVFYADSSSSLLDNSNISRHGLDHAVNRNVDIARANGLDPSKEQIRHQYDNPSVNRMASDSNKNRYHSVFSIMNQGGGRSAGHF